MRVRALGENSGEKLSDSFASTHWSVITAAAKREADPETAHAALTELCQTYWPPLYSFVRRRGYSLHDAQDLTQNFFAYLIEAKIYDRVDREKGKFRSFLLASIKNFLADNRDREQALKRGGGLEFLPFDEEEMAEVENSLTTETIAGHESSEDHFFERTWAETLVRGSLENLAFSYQTEGKENLFQQLRIFLTGSADPLPSYGELARQIGMRESTLRSHVTRLRARYREALRAEVRRTVAREAEVEAELRELLRVLTTAA